MTPHVKVFTDRSLAILDRAAYLGGERYKLSAIVAKDDPTRWQRLADIDRERASLELELQHVNAIIVTAAVDPPGSCFPIYQQHRRGFACCSCGDGCRVEGHSDSTIF